jgi:hypothetical protein
MAWRVVRPPSSESRFIIPAQISSVVHATVRTHDDAAGRSRPGNFAAMQTRGVVWAAMRRPAKRLRFSWRAHHQRHLTHTTPPVRKEAPSLADARFLRHWRRRVRLYRQSHHGILETHPWPFVSPHTPSPVHGAQRARTLHRLRVTAAVESTLCTHGNSFLNFASSGTHRKVPLRWMLLCKAVVGVLHPVFWPKRLTKRILTIPQDSPGMRAASTALLLTHSTNGFLQPRCRCSRTCRRLRQHGHRSTWFVTQPLSLTKSIGESCHVYIVTISR